MQCHTKQKHTSVTIQKLNQASKYTMQPVCICRKGEKLSYPALEINFMMGARDTKQLFFFFCNDAAQCSFTAGVHSAGNKPHNHVALLPTDLMEIQPKKKNKQDSDLLVITILDENDNRPIFTRTSYRAEVTENSKGGRK